MRDRSEASFDYVLVGGGLSNALTALALFRAWPAVRVALVEQQETLGGNHVWCFHAGDVKEQASAFVWPLVEHSWPGYDVRFPDLSRSLDEPYAAVRSQRVHEVVSREFAARPECRLLLGQRAESVTSTAASLASGEMLRGAVVIEARGPDHLAPGVFGYQKFLGLELKLKAPPPIDRPLLMDALVPQRDGFRFMYALPLGRDRVLLEDTYFSESPELDRERLEAEIIGYAERNGYAVQYVAREETGVLPLPTRLSSAPNPAPGGPFIAGYQGAWFHPVTGYSFPVAVRVAEAVASASAGELASTVWPELVREQRRQLRFCLFLNRLFFGAFAPEKRRHVIERFYRLPTETVRRFYAMQLSHADRARILCGRPPRGFSLQRALLAPALAEGNPS
jgi:lycopene beta-cyclase